MAMAAKKKNVRLLKPGARRHAPVADVGGGIRPGTVKDPFGNFPGVIGNPHFNILPH